MLAVTGMSAVDSGTFTAPKLVVLATTRPDVHPASYWGPSGFMEIQGVPGPAKISGRAADPAAGARLWDASQAMTDNPFGEGA